MCPEYHEKVTLKKPPLLKKNLKHFKNPKSMILVPKTWEKLQKKNILKNPQLFWEDVKEY